MKEYYPKQSAIWMTGHSLGGALAGLVALTNDLPAFAFESPGDMVLICNLDVCFKIGAFARRS